MTGKRKQFPLRMSEELYQTYERWASDEFRSVNAQIEAVLSAAASKIGRLKNQNGS
ncbi:MAG: hypothetical protein QF596_01830 [Acidimicrobiales bacterium]|jgi:hypothetical protein|nr:hypothetical protein [Acidimicrobiales bacterium]MDP6299576.1 hypothetical protein [Acidimicrobiales bacterium]HJM27653.1 DNA-binding protein [Acidimicrobiales bacterium]HJM97511.1 DNA-binding protein [Acidimicrobiales bacterium]